MADFPTKNQPVYKVGQAVIYASTIGTIAEIDPASSSALVDFYFISLWIPTILLAPSQSGSVLSPLSNEWRGAGGEDELGGGK